METDHNDKAAAHLRSLLRQTTKTTLFLLSAVLVVLIGMWSTLKAGKEKDNDLVREFAVQHPEILKNLSMKESELASDEGVDRIRTHIAVSKRLNTFFVRSLAGDAPAESAVQPFGEKLAEINELERREAAVYLVQASVPYLKTTVTLNTLILADIWPFVILVAACGLISIKLQQRTYEILLASMGSERRPAGSDFGIARIEYALGTLSRCQHQSCECLLYRKPIVIVPGNLLAIALAFVTMYLSAELFVLYNPTGIHRTSSILFSYYSLFWTVTVLGAAWVVRTKMYFNRELTDTLKVPVLSARLHGLVAHLLKTLPAKLLYERTELLRRVRSLSSRGWSVACCLAGLGCLTLPFVSPWGIAGFRLLLKQKPLVTAPIAEGKSIEMFRIDLVSYRELRVHLTIGVLFLLLCVLCDLLPNLRTHRLSRLLSSVRRVAAYGIMFLAGNLLFYLGVLQYQSMTNPSPAVVDSFFPEGLVAPHGMSLIFADPSYGAWIFISLCIFEALLALSQGRAQSHREIPTSTSRAATAT